MNGMRCATCWRPLTGREPCPHCYNLRRRKVTHERVNQADAYLNDVDLPGYLETVGALSRLYAAMLTTPYGGRDTPGALEEARDLLKRLEGRL